MFSPDYSGLAKTNLIFIVKIGLLLRVVYQIIARGLSKMMLFAGDQRAGDLLVTPFLKTEAHNRPPKTSLSRYTEHKGALTWEPLCLQMTFKNGGVFGGHGACGIGSAATEIKANG